jgi:hypothetical protein
MKMSMTRGDWFVKQASLSPSAGSVALPSDCAKPIYLEVTSSNYQIPLRATVRDREKILTTGASLSDFPVEAYVMGNYIKFSDTTYATACTLWYDKRLVRPIAGISTAGGATSLTLENNMDHSPEDDYYNGITMEIGDEDGGWERAEVSDYDATTRVLTLATGSFGASYKYGSVPDLPQEAYDAWIARSAYMTAVKPAGVVKMDYVTLLRDDAKEAEKLFFEWISTRIKNVSRIGAIL